MAISQLKTNLLRNCQEMAKAHEVAEPIFFDIGGLGLSLEIEGPESATARAFFSRYLETFINSQENPNLQQPRLRIRYRHLAGEYGSIEAPFWSEHWPTYSVNSMADGSIEILNRDFVALVHPGGGLIDAWGPIIGKVNTVTFDNLLLASLSEHLLEKSSLVLHASAFVSEDKAYCFMGPSGVGKSTLATAAWEKYRLRVLGGDRILVRLHNGKAYASALPVAMSEFVYDHPARIYGEFELEGLLHLTRSEDWKFKRLNSGQIIGALVRETLSFQPDRIPAQAHLDLCLAMVQRVKVLAEWSYMLGFDFWPRLQENLILALRKDEYVSR